MRRVTGPTSFESKLTKMDYQRSGQLCRVVQLFICFTSHSNSLCALVTAMTFGKNVVSAFVLITLEVMRDPQMS